MMYKLTENGVIRLDTQTAIPNDTLNAEWQNYLLWLTAGNTPEPADVLTTEQQARIEEMRQAQPVARAWFAGHPAAVAFIRLTPAEQEAQIDAMTTAQLKTLLKYLTAAVAVLVKRELL